MKTIIAVDVDCILNWSWKIEAFDCWNYLLYLQCI